MTRDRYLEMCEMLGSQPIEEQIPVEFDELPEQAQQAFIVYKYLKDDWDTMNGVYQGKIFTGIKDIFEMLEVDKSEYRLMYQLLLTIDDIRAKELRKKKPVENNKSRQ